MPVTCKMAGIWEVVQNVIKQATTANKPNILAAPQILILQYRGLEQIAMPSRTSLFYVI